MKAGDKLGTFVQHLNMSILNQRLSLFLSLPVEVSNLLWRLLISCPDNFLKFLIWKFPKITA